MEETRKLINEQKHNITIEANIIFEGKSATQAKAKLMKNDIMETRGSMKEYSIIGETYQIDWKIDVKCKRELEQHLNMVLQPIISIYKIENPNLS